jgi:hypothetical protein
MLKKSIIVLICHRHEHLVVIYITSARQFLLPHTFYYTDQSSRIHITLRHHIDPYRKDTLT